MYLSGVEQLDQELPLVCRGLALTGQCTCTGHSGRHSLCFCSWCAQAPGPACQQLLVGDLKVQHPTVYCRLHDYQGSLVLAAVSYIVTVMPYSVVPVLEAAELSTGFS